MAQLQVRWNRLCGIYFVLAALCLAVAGCTPAPWHAPFLAIGVCLLAAFVPLIMAIYFLRGFLRIH